MSYDFIIKMRENDQSQWINWWKTKEKKISLYKGSLFSVIAFPPAAHLVGLVKLVSFSKSLS